MNMRLAHYQAWNPASPCTITNSKRSNSQRATIGYDPYQAMIYYQNIPQQFHAIAQQSHYIPAAQFAQSNFAIPVTYNKIYHDSVATIIVPQQDQIFTQQQQGIRRTPQVEVPAGTYVQQQKTIRTGAGQAQPLIEPKQKIKKDTIIELPQEGGKDDFSFSLQKPFFCPNADAPPGYFNIIGRGNLPTITFISE